MTADPNDVHLRDYSMCSFLFLPSLLATRHSFLTLSFFISVIDNE